MEEFKNSIEEYLQTRDLYHTSDAILIAELIFNIEVAEDAKKDIRKNGIQVDITRSPDKEPFYQKNRAVDVYQQCLKNIQSLFRQLVLSPQERQRLKIELADGLDAFDKAF